LLERLEVEALAADWHVHFSTAYELNLVADGCAQSKTSWITANLANSLELFNLFTLRYQVKHIVKWFAKRCPAKHGHYDNFAFRSGKLGKRNNLREG
jgi:hypothetical protein